MSRIVDRGAIIAAYVGIGMAVTMAIGFLLVIPIQPIYVLLSFPGGMVIGYYANARAGRQRGAWRRILPNSLLAGAVTGLSLAALLLGTRALFFFADSGYPDFNRTDPNGVPVGTTCQTGADCVYQRYLADRPEALAEAGIRDAATFERVYWDEQRSTALSLVLVTTVAGAVGGVLFGLTRPKAGPRAAEHPGPASA